jgi:hypothetical protein
MYIIYSTHNVECTVRTHINYHISTSNSLFLYIHLSNILLYVSCISISTKIHPDAVYNTHL